ncbi:MAG: hypothetical protein HZC45_03195 [Deltaproteobacteria bacterium]|nr:hypothetical protein [Deltaproteobacteria bacterium]
MEDLRKIANGSSGRNGNEGADWRYKKEGLKKIFWMERKGDFQRQAIEIT